MTDKQNETQAKRMHVEPDRLSSLSDDLVHKIFSSFGIKHVVQTSVLSSRWRFVWTSMPYLDFSSEDFSTLLKFSNSVKHVLSGRNNDIEVSSVKLSFRGKVCQMFVKRVLDYAFSHNVQEMSVTCLGNNSVDFPLSLFNSQSLKHLTLIGSGRLSFTRATSIWELPALTQLHLEHLRIDDCDDGLFSKCTKLKNLTFSHVINCGSNRFRICHPQLSNLTLQNVRKCVEVAAPRLKNLSLAVQYCYIIPLFSDGLPLLEKVDLCIHYPNNARNIIDWFKQFHAVKSLTVNMDIIQLLSSSVDLISNQPCPFANLKSLKIYPVIRNSPGQALVKVDVSPVVKSYFLDSSPSATFTLVSHEEMKAVKNTKLALEHIPKLRVLLDELKTDLDHGKAPKKSSKGKSRDTEKWNQGAKPGKKMPRIRSCWDDLSLRMNYEKKKGFSYLFRIGVHGRIVDSSAGVREGQDSSMFC